MKSFMNFSNKQHDMMEIPAPKAREVARLLHPHFLKEEEFALPPLSLLSSLAEGRTPHNMDEIIRVTAKLKQELPSMLEEHSRIKNALEELISSAEKEDHPEVVAFAHKLMQHAKTEEEVSYPAAILVGELLKCRLKNEQD